MCFNVTLCTYRIVRALPDVVMLDITYEIVCHLSQQTWFSITSTTQCTKVCKIQSCMCKTVQKVLCLLQACLNHLNYLDECRFIDKLLLKEDLVIQLISLIKIQLYACKGCGQLGSNTSAIRTSCKQTDYLHSCYLVYNDLTSIM